MRPGIVCCPIQQLYTRRLIHSAQLLNRRDLSDKSLLSPQFHNLKIDGTKAGGI